MTLIFRGSCSGGGGGGAGQTADMHADMGSYTNGGSGAPWWEEWDPSEAETRQQRGAPKKPKPWQAPADSDAQLLNGLGTEVRHSRGSTGTDAAVTKRYAVKCMVQRPSLDNPILQLHGPQPVVVAAAWHMIDSTCAVCRGCTSRLLPLQALKAEVVRRQGAVLSPKPGSDESKMDPIIRQARLRCAAPNSIPCQSKAVTA